MNPIKRLKNILPENERKPFELFSLGYTVTQVALLTGLGVPVVEGLLHHAILTAREALRAIRA